MTLENKKKKEFNILSYVINKIDTSASILPLEEAKKNFSHYNGENPDFIISQNNEFIGIELFELTPDESETGYSNIVNNAHLSRKKPKEVFQVPDLADVCIERINAKNKKIPYYVTNKIWLLGYSIEFYNAFMIKLCYKDKTINEVIKYIKEQTKINSKIEKILLYERMSKEYLIDILDFNP